MVEARRRRSLPAGARPVEQSPGQRWGLGDAVVGFVAAQVLSVAVGAVVLGILVVRGMAAGVSAAAALDGDARTISAGLTVGGLGLLQVPLWATELGTVWWAGEVRGTGVRRDFGLRLRPLDIVVGLVAGALTQGVVSLGYSIVQHVFDWTVSDRSAQQIAAKGHGVLGVGALLVLFAGVAPLVEELFYRGLVQRSVERHLPAMWALLITSLLFAAIHLQPVLLPGLFVAGLVFGTLAQRTGRLGPAIFAHIGFNASTILYLVLNR